jgi:hypothetical protein
MHGSRPSDPASIRSGRYTWAMPECPVCRREFDARFQVFAPPGHEPFDTVECARRAVRTADADEILALTLLPTIELFPIPRPPAAVPSALSSTTRRRLAAAIAVPFAASPAAVAAGLSLVAAGTATSVYLWSPALDKAGQVAAAQALPAQPFAPGDTSEGHAPPPPVTGRVEEQPEAAAAVALVDARVADAVAQAKSDATEDAPAVTVETSPGSSTEPEDPPAASHGRPVSPGEASSPRG